MFTRDAMATIINIDLKSPLLRQNAVFYMRSLSPSQTEKIRLWEFFYWHSIKRHWSIWVKVFYLKYEQTKLLLKIIVSSVLQLRAQRNHTLTSLQSLSLYKAQMALPPLADKHFRVATLSLPILPPNGQKTRAFSSTPVCGHLKRPVFVLYVTSSRHTATERQGKGSFLSLFKPTPDTLQKNS